MTITRKNLAIRVDAYTGIGTGHVMRCIALAQAWQDRGGDVTFLSYCDSEGLHQRIIDEGFVFIPIEKPHPYPSDLTQTLNILKRHAPCSMPNAFWFVVDGYHFTPDYQKVIRKNGYRLLVIDDMAHLDHYHADILLNQNIHASSLHYSCDRDTVKLLGCEYVLLRMEFLKYKDWKREIPDKAKKILVTMGGGDPDNVTLKVINAIKRLDDPDLEIKVIVGFSNPHVLDIKNAMLPAPCSMLCIENTTNMPGLMAWADMAVSAGGSTCWEIAFMGLPSLIITTADNQAGIAKGLGKAGAGIDLGWHKNISIKQYAHALKEILQDKNKRLSLSEQGQKLVNGKGRQKIIKAMLAEQIKLRRAQENDCELLWKWANDPDNRAVSFSSAPIPWEDHTHWFNSKLNSANCMMYIATMNDRTPLGQIRYDIKQENALISISIDKKFRSKGYGVVLIRKTSQILFNESNVRRVHAYVKQDNNASANVFTKTGFKKLELTTIHAQPATHFVLEGFTL
jgi:UDP-2,4-diacetamido-2,4,6-trideoxy-beta-L-altropyranose hydrolase